MNRLRVLLKEPGKKPKEVYIPEKERAYVQALGGPVEYLNVWRDMCIICLQDQSGERDRIGIAGPYIIAGDIGANHNEVTPCDLTRQQVEQLKERWTKDG